MSKFHFKHGLVLLVIAIGVLYYFGTRTTLTDEIAEANELGKNWIFQNLRDKGLFVYSIDPKTGNVENNNNAIRQLMTSRVLAQESNNNTKLQDLHRKNLDFIFDFWYRTEGDFGYVLYSDKSKLGANAMLLRTLAHSPFFEEYKTEAEKLAKGILELQNEDGSFRAWYIAPAYEYDEERLLTFYSGEALLALVEHYEKTKDQVYLDAAKLSADFYIDEYVIRIEENYYPAYVPWHTLALNKLYKITGDSRYVEAVFVMNDKLLEIQDTTKFRGRFFNPETPQYGTPHGSSDAVYTEGMAYAYELAKLIGDTEHEVRYRDAIEISLYNLGTLQYKKPSELLKSSPEEYIGAIRTRADSTWIRVDTTQHTVDALTKILEVL